MIRRCTPHKMNRTLDFMENLPRFLFLEPSNQQEAYNMMHYAFDLSEETQLPVLLRMVTRLSHSRSGVTFKERRAQNGIQLPVNTDRFALVPSNARKQYDKLVHKKNDLLAASEKSPFNKIGQHKDSSLGIVACGIGYNYVMENLADDLEFFSLLKISQYPLPKEKLKKLYQDCDEVLVVEEGYPLVEELIHDYFDETSKSYGKT